MRLTLDGEWPSLDQMVSLQKTLGDMRGVSRVLIDIRKASGPLPKFPGIRETVTALTAHPAAAQRRRRAVIVSSDVQFGIARSFQALLPGDIEVFRDEADALAWLLVS